MKVKTSLLVALVAACIIPSISHAGDQAGKAPKNFVKYDTDSNGLLSKEEVAAHKGFTKRFAKLDTDSDGSISIAEFKVDAKARAAKKKAKAATATAAE